MRNCIPLEDLRFLRGYRILINELISVIFFFFFNRRFFYFFLRRFIVHGAACVILEWLLWFKWWNLNDIFWEGWGLNVATIVLCGWAFIIDGSSFIFEIVLWLLYFFICFIIKRASIINKFFFFGRRRGYKDRFRLLRRE